MSKVYVFLAEGFEEIEGLTVVDLLRRAKIETEMVSIMETKQVKGSHGIEVSADSLFTDNDYADAELLVLPGGMPGTLNLGNHEGLCELLKKHYGEDKMIAAICAAPSVFGQLGFLNGRIATFLRWCPGRCPQRLPLGCPFLTYCSMRPLLRCVPENEGAARTYAYFVFYHRCGQCRFQ